MMQSRRKQSRNRRRQTFGLWCGFENPDADARAVNVFWQRSIHRHVLPLVACTEYGAGEGHYFTFDGLRCRVTVLRDTRHDRQHILFAESGRALQLEISAASRLDEGILFMPVLPAPGIRVARVMAVRRLADLMAQSVLRPSLYPRERSHPRLMRVIQALDGSLANARHRDIGIALYGQARVERDWHHPYNYLRDYVRRAIRYGRKLMNGGYRQFLT